MKKTRKRAVKSPQLFNFMGTGPKPQALKFGTGPRTKKVSFFGGALPQKNLSMVGRQVNFMGKKKPIKSPNFLGGANSVNFMGSKVPKTVNFIPAAKRTNRVRKKKGPLFGLNITNVNSPNTFNLSPKKVKPTMSFIPPAPKKRGKERINQPFLSKWGDADMDGTPNFLDCNPRNVGEDGFMDVMKGLGAKAVGAFKGRPDEKEKEFERVKTQRMALERLKTAKKIELIEADAKEKRDRLKEEEDEMRGEYTQVGDELEQSDVEKKIKEVKEKIEKVQEVEGYAKEAFQSKISETERLAKDKIQEEKAALASLGTLALEKRQAIDDIKEAILNRRGEDESKIASLKEGKISKKDLNENIENIKADSKRWVTDKEKSILGIRKDIRGISEQKIEKSQAIKTISETAAKNKELLSTGLKTAIGKISTKAGDYEKKSKILFGTKKSLEEGLSSVEEKIEKKTGEIEKLDKATKTSILKKKRAWEFRNMEENIKLKNKQATARVIRVKKARGAFKDTLGIKINPDTGRFTKRSLASQKKRATGMLNIVSALVPGPIAGSRAIYGQGKKAKAAGPKRPVGRPKGSYKHYIPGRGAVSGAEYDKWVKIQKMKGKRVGTMQYSGQVGTIDGPKPVYRTKEPQQLSTGIDMDPEVMTAQVMEAKPIESSPENQAVKQPMAQVQGNSYEEQIKARQRYEQQHDNVLNVEKIQAPNIMKGEMVGQAPEDNILNAPNINEGGMRNVQGEKVEGVELGDRPQTNPHGDEYLEIEPGSGKAYIKRRITEKWATGEAL